MESQPSSKLLEFVLLPCDKLCETDVQRMFKLMEESYDHMDYLTFVKDLSDKVYVGLLFDSEKCIQGFTTFGINPKGTGNSGYSIIFSGDTVISPEHWGSQEMMRGWGTSVGKIIADDPSKDWYWFLLSKGHRTYMYLPLFFNEYYPSVQENNYDNLLKVLNETALKLYPGSFNSLSGVIVFDKKMGELKPSLAQTTFDKQSKPHVKFFLEKNPEFFQGNELVCVARLHPDNIKGYGKKYIVEGMQQKLP
ncbi:MAG: hypothetical protein ABIW34_07020 [Ginsengibacter sp.]